MTRAPRIAQILQDHIFDCFVDDMTAVQTVKQADKQCARWGMPIPAGRKHIVSRPCVNRYFKHYRELIFEATDRAPRFDGEIEIDIGFFAGRAQKYTADYVRRLAGLPAAKIVAARKEVRIMKKRKQAVLGFLRRHGDIYLLIIDSKSRKQLESAVRLVVKPGSIIYTDGETGLAKIKLQGYTHHAIHHSKGYVDRGKHINGIESFWREARRSMGKSFRGIPRTTLRLHIKEREFRYNHRRDMAEALKSLSTTAQA